MRANDPRYGMDHAIRAPRTRLVERIPELRAMERQLVAKGLYRWRPEPAYSRAEADGALLIDPFSGHLETLRQLPNTTARLMLSNHISICIH